MKLLKNEDSNDRRRACAPSFPHNLDTKIPNKASEIERNQHRARRSQLVDKFAYIIESHLSLLLAPSVQGACIDEKRLDPQGTQSSVPCGQVTASPWMGSGYA